MGAYSQDIIGQQSCYILQGQTIPAKTRRLPYTVSAENYCRQMKTVLAFSWGNFVFLIIALTGLLVVVFKLYARGQRDIWKDSMSDVELFREKEFAMPPVLPAPPMPADYPPASQVGSGTGSGTGRSGHTFIYYPGSHGAPLQHQVVQQQPGHSVIIHNGQVTQVPGSVTSV
ncbi:hypothetical protein RhiLY_00810 [Ceratobasidium sp. AG-Ba]|nr:hypothetical protein RhiLY_00810 [Ceratobasidium sp. AG-Ba]